MWWTTILKFLRIVRDFVCILCGEKQTCTKGEIEAKGWKQTVKGWVCKVCGAAQATKDL